MEKKKKLLVNFEFNDPTVMRLRLVWCYRDGSGPKVRADSRTAESTEQAAHNQGENGTNQTRHTRGRAYCDSTDPLPPAIRANSRSDGACCTLVSVTADVHLASCTANDEPGTGSKRPRRANDKQTTSHNKRATTSKQREAKGANEDDFREVKSADRRSIRRKASGIRARWDH